MWEMTRLTVFVESWMRDYRSSYENLYIKNGTLERFPKCHIVRLLTHFYTFELEHFFAHAVDFSVNGLTCAKCCKWHTGC